MVARLIWFAASSRLRGTRFGTVASLAGIQNSATHSISTVATYSQVSVFTSGIVMNSRPRRVSPTTIVARRLSRSASAPASGPSTTAGASRRMNTPATARFAVV